MDEPPGRFLRFFQELRRRNVYRVAVTYGVVAFVIWQVADQLFPALGFPGWTTDFVVVLTLLGFPVALVVAWAFEMTPEGVRRTSDTSAQGWDRRARSPPTSDGSWKRYLIGLTAVGALLLSGWAVWRFVEGPAGTATDVSSSVVAVLPFSVQGAGDTEYLGEGMVSLLTTKFDGVGDLRSVDARALLSYFQGVRNPSLNPEEGQTVAERFGAGYFVMGDVVEVRGHLTINAALYDARRGLPAVEEATVEGAADSISSLVDELAAPLLASVSGGTGSDVARMAALTTKSLPALRAYLEGESALRDGDFRAALEAFQRAVERDTLFALGYYRLSIAAEWLTDLDPMIEASDRALRYADRLNDRYRRLLTAFSAFRRGKNRRAQELYRSILNEYPDNVEAWLYLGEALFHTNPYQGKPVSESWNAFRRVMEYEPGNAASLVHMIRIAGMQGRRGTVDSLFSRYGELNPEGDRLLSVRALVASVEGDEEAWREVVEGLRASRGSTVALALVNVGVYARDLRRATELARLLTNEDRSVEERAAGFKWLAMAQVARGRWEAADRTLTALADVDPLTARETRGYLYLIPHAPVSRSELRGLRDRLLEHEDTDAAPSDLSSLFFSVHDRLHPFIRAYLVGRLSARLGEPDRARAWIRELGELPAPKGAGTLAEDLAHGIRAELALRTGDSTVALQEIQQVRTDVVYNYSISSFLYGEVHERFMRPELLSAAGREREAVKWYESQVKTGFVEIPYLGLVHLGLGRSKERLGESAAAASHYRRFLELWSEADPELRSLVEEVRQRHQELTGAGAEVSFRSP